MKKWSAFLLFNFFFASIVFSQVDAVKIATEYEKILKDGKAIPYRHSMLIIYKDFNKVVDRFFSNPYEVIDGEARFF